MLQVPISKFISCATILRFIALFHSLSILFLLLLFLCGTSNTSSLFLFTRSNHLPSFPSLCLLQPVACATHKTCGITNHWAWGRNGWVGSFLDTKYAEIVALTNITIGTASWLLWMLLGICLPGRARTTSFSSWCRTLSNLL